MTCDVALREAGAGIREEVGPLALEGGVVGRIFERGVVCADEVLREVRLEAAAPFTEGAWVVCIY